MKEAFEHVAHKLGIRAKYSQNLTKTQLSVHGAQNRDWYLSMVRWTTKGSPNNGYHGRLEGQREHFGQWLK